MLGAVGFVVIGQFTMRAYGTAGGVAAFTLVLLAWWGSYAWKEKMMDRAWHEFSALPKEKQTEILARSDETFCAAMAKRDAKKKPIQPPGPTRGNGA